MFGASCAACLGRSGGVQARNRNNTRGKKAYGRTTAEGSPAKRLDQPNRSKLNLATTIPQINKNKVVFGVFGVLFIICEVLGIF